MHIAAMTRWVLRNLMAAAVIIALLGLNVATLVSSTVSDALTNTLRIALSTLSEGVGQSLPKSRVEIEADRKAALGTADRAVAEREMAKAETAATRRQLTTALTDLEVARHEVVVAEQKASVAIADRDAARVEKSVAVREAASAKAAMSAAEAEKLAARSELEALDLRRGQAIRTIEGLKARATRAIRRNAASEVAQGVPFIGTAVVLGAMAYDVNDACEQMRGLTAMDAALRGMDTPAGVDEQVCLMSYDDLVAAFTGRDKGYAVCVADRIARNELDPPSCAAYGTAIPDISDGPLLAPRTAVTLPEIR